MDRSDGANLPGSPIRHYRRAAGLTQHELAWRAGISVGAIRDLEQGRTHRPLPQSLAALINVLGLSPAQAAELKRAAAASGPWLQILGPLAAWRKNTAVPLGGPGQRAVLGLLAMAPGSLVHREMIIDVLWPADPPATAVNLVQAHVSRLRRILDPGGPPPHRGGLLQAGPALLDLLAFRQLAAEARAARSGADNAAACDLYQQALELWRGEPLGDVDLLRGHPALTGLARQHSELVLEYARAAIAAGWHDRVLGLLRELADHEPLNEQAHGQLMIALSGSGQQAEAFTVYHDLCRRLDEELGMPAGPDLAAAHQLVLRQEIPGAPLAMTAETAHAVVPRQLPAAPAFFVGRAAELAVLDSLPDAAAQTVVITAIGGTAGIGKTALAVHWAALAAAEFPDGQLYVNLRGFDQSGTPVPPTEAIRGFLDAIGVPPERIPVGLDSQADLYRSMLAGKRMLIVLDNARDVEQVRPLLPGSSGCLVMVTSRARLAGLAVGEGARLLTLDVLTEDEAHQLLARRLESGRVAAEPGAASELIQLCARLPLALAIAAARAAERPNLPLAGLAAELSGAGGRLDGLDAGDPASSVRTVISWSYQSLRAPAAQMFRLLGVHRGPDISTAAAASLAGVPLPAARRALADLIAAHLLTEHSPGRYAFHDLLRAYAAEQAQSSASAPELREATGRVLGYFAATGCAAALLLNPARDASSLPAPGLMPGVGPDQLADRPQALAWYEAEHKSLVAAIMQAAGAGFDSYACQLTWCMADFLDRRGSWHDWVTAQQAALPAAVRLGDRSVQARTERGLGRAYTELGALPEAAAHLQRALDLDEQLGNLSGQANTHLALARVLEYQRSYHQATDHARQALGLFLARGDTAGQARALNGIGWFQVHLGSYQEAVRCCEEALHLYQLTEDRRGEATTLDSLGFAHHHLGNHARAVACYWRAAEGFRDLGDRPNLIGTLTHMRDSYEAAGETGSAQAAWERALTILDDLDHADADRVREKLRTLMP
jgi:DNA-binding SARP family transcriptional activator/tetratricopeptide (TPR) repeat protein/DNA-binding XRE family transcriptional regulator